jgi:hypothetical protein
MMTTTGAAIQNKNFFKYRDFITHPAVSSQTTQGPGLTLMKN